MSKDDWFNAYERALDNGHSQSAAIAHANEGGCSVRPDPIPARRIRSVGDLAAIVASEANEQGHSLSGDDIRQFANRLHNLVVHEYGDSGRLYGGGK